MVKKKKARIYCKNVMGKFIAKKWHPNEPMAPQNLHSCLYLYNNFG